MPKSVGVSTKTQIEALEPKATNYPVPVVPKRGEGVRGLAVQVTPAGCKSFVLRFRFHGKQKTLTLGKFPTMGVEQAITLARAKWSEIDEGKNPSDTKREYRQSVTVNDLAARYILEHIPDNSDSWGAGATRLINLHILPALGKVPVAVVGPADVSALLYKLKRTPTEARLTRAVLRTMFRRGEEWGYRDLGTNPVSVVKLQAQSVKRDRRLTDLEMKALGVGLTGSKEPATCILAVRLALLAGMRKGEIQVLRWSWVDLEAEEIRIPADSHKSGRKTGKVRVVHLCSTLVAHLKATVPTLGCPFVVPGKPRADDEGKPLPWEPMVGLQAPWERIRAAAGLAPKDKTGAYLDEENNPGWHDLRRTFASVGADLGLKGFVGELLGHAEATVTDIYTRAAAEALHDAAEKIGARIEGILSGRIDPEKEAQDRRDAKEAKAHA